MDGSDPADTNQLERQQLERLARFLHDVAYPDAAGVTIGEVRRPRGGMSWETFFLEIVIEQNDGTRCEWLVVKRAPGAVGPLGPYNAHKDAVIIGALHGHVPVPRLVAHSDDPEVFGRPFFAVELIEGESDDLFRVEHWPTWQQHRDELARSIVSTLADLHRFRWQDSAVLDVVDAPSSIVAGLRPMVDWYTAPYREPRSEFTVPQLFWRDLGVWLLDNAPEIDVDEMAIVHGDFRFGNLMWRGTELAAIIDWERAMIGDPMSNLGFFAMPMARRRQPELMGMAATFERLDELHRELAGAPIDRRRFQFYMIFWQFIEGSLGSRPTPARAAGEAPGGTDLSRRRSRVGTLPIGPNLHLNQTSRLVDAFERGDHDVL